MEKRKSAIICVIIVAASFLGILFATLGGFSFLQEGDSENQSLSIRLEPEKSSYPLRELVKVKIYVVNFSNETMKFHGGVLSHRSTVFDSKGEFVAGFATFYTRISDYYLEVPAQSEALGDTIEWNQKSSSFDSSTNSYMYVDSGVYTIRTTIHLGERGSVTSQAQIETRG
jgi:hypothetical protein